MNAEDPRLLTAAPRRPWYRLLYVQVLIAIVIGALLGVVYPGKAGFAAQMKPFGDAFVNLIRMMIAPVIFCTVVHGIATMGDLKRVGRVGIKAILYFEVVSTLALAIGLIVADVVKPGAGFNIDPKTLDASSVATYVTAAKGDSVMAHLLSIIPTSYGDVFAKGDLLQVLLVAILTGIAISRLGEVGERVAAGIDAAGKVFFRIIGIIVHFAPDRRLRGHGLHDRRLWLQSLAYLGELIATFYLTACSSSSSCSASSPGRRILDPPLHRLHQGRVAHRARHLVLRDGAAAA